MMDPRVRATRPQIRRAVFVAVVALWIPRPALAQDLGILEVFGKFVGSFKAASAFYAPVGSVISNDALRASGASSILCR